MSRRTAGIALLAWLLAGCSLTVREPTLQWTATGAIAADCASTVASVPSAGFEETNPLLGKEPTPPEIVGWCMLGMAATHGVSAALPKNWRKGWLAWITVMELTYFLHNVTMSR
jgi:hypothetical protein